MAFRPQEQLPRPLGRGDPLSGAEDRRGVRNLRGIPSSGFGT